MSLYTLDLLKPHVVYRNKEGKRVPGTTTILEETMGSRELINWANEQGLQGVDTQKTVRNLADIGTVAHARIEAELRGMTFDTSNLSPDLVSRSMPAFERFMMWWERECYEPVVLELVMVSEKLQVGGTLDVLARKDGHLELVDIKTSKAVYKKHKIQVGGSYAPMYEEITGEKIERVKIARIGRDEEGDFEVTELFNREVLEAAFASAAIHYRNIQKVR